MELCPKDAWDVDLPELEKAASCQLSRRRDTRERQRCRKRLYSLPQPRALQFYYELPLSSLPRSLRASLPKWARKECCYLQLYISHPSGLVFWNHAELPNCCKIAIFQKKLGDAPVLMLSEDEATQLIAQIEHATQSVDIYAAPGSFLAEELRAVIAPEVSYQEEPITPEMHRVEIEGGHQVPIPPTIFQTSLTDVKLPPRLRRSLEEAKITTIGEVLELELEVLVEFLDSADLFELQVALMAVAALPTPDGLISASQPPAPPQQLYEEFYYYICPETMYYDSDRGCFLYMVRASSLADRLKRQSGKVYTLWLTQDQVERSWQRSLEHIDTFERRLIVTTHALEEEGTLSQEPREKEGEAATISPYRDQERLEALFDRVPLATPQKEDQEKDPTPVELFIKATDPALFDENIRSVRGIVLDVVKRYIENPLLQPVGDFLSSQTLQSIIEALYEDRTRTRQSLSTWKRVFPGTPPPSTHSFIAQPAHIIKRKKIWVKEKKKFSQQEFKECIGVRVIIGVLPGSATTIAPRAQRHIATVA